MYHQDDIKMPESKKIIDFFAKERVIKELERQTFWTFTVYIGTLTVTTLIALSVVVLPLMGKINIPEAVIGGLSSGSPLALISTVLGKKAKESRDKFCQTVREFKKDSSNTW
ncbi:MAG: hypothetical protein RMY28_036085 [Nostoc sp. ChiSLP01]|nr:hypothetical protein [Nostoc sp. CmiSLP01]MDZ8282573.1 hypothetical protein [Nostoc sp. ChiSLP01]